LEPREREIDDDYYGGDGDVAALCLKTREGPKGEERDSRDSW